MSEIKIQRKSVSLSTKLAAIKLFGVGNRVRSVTFKLDICVGISKKALKKDDLLREG